MKHDKCAPANVLEHADSVFACAISLSLQVKALVDHLCGAMPEPCGKDQAGSHGSAFANLRNRAEDANASIEDAKCALRRLESEVGYYSEPTDQAGSGSVTWMAPPRKF